MTQPQLSKEEDDSPGYQIKIHLDLVSAAENNPRDWTVVKHRSVHTPHRALNRRSGQTDTRVVGIAGDADLYKLLRVIAYIRQYLASKCFYREREADSLRRTSGT